MVKCCLDLHMSLVTQPMLQRRPNCSKLRLTYSKSCRFQKCKQKSPPPSLLKKSFFFQSLPWGTKGKNLKKIQSTSTPILKFRLGSFSPPPSHSVNNNKSLSIKYLKVEYNYVCKLCQFLTTYLPLFTLVDIWTTTYLPVNVDM